MTPRSRTLRPLVALAMPALISLGCAGSSGGTDGETSNHDQAVMFAECMRGNGVGTFPDPDASGQLTIDGVVNGSSVDPDSAAFKQALDACKGLQPPGFTGHARNAQEQDGALKFAQCVRENGVKDFPDPSPDAPLVDTNRIPSAASGDLSVLNAAMKTCGDLAAGAGVSGGR
jgi:hypothetical protein